eukprot:TRINITY_DN19539_c0_g1_i1.p1 TRINITY_DN19539_c0_g1~~TRINITY_DN19539_c0_g1_i1.p1  ORF type:complete len:300 (-),score=47.86 TRINITY_DN19539_c0_g1_i1:86-985(-)
MLQLTFTNFQMRPIVGHGLSTSIEVAGRKIQGPFMLDGIFQFNLPEGKQIPPAEISILHNENVVAISSIELKDKHGMQPLNFQKVNPNFQTIFSCQISVRITSSGRPQRSNVEENKEQLHKEESTIIDLKPLNELNYLLQKENLRLRTENEALHRVIEAEKQKNKALELEIARLKGQNSFEELVDESSKLTEVMPVQNHEKGFNLEEMLEREVFDDESIETDPKLIAELLATAKSEEKAKVQTRKQEGRSGSDFTVYKTQTGKKYHKDGCSWLLSRIPIKKSEAVSLGLMPCMRCVPDE